jgi:hypothetical protein
MTEANELSSAVRALRQAAAELAERADQLEALGSESLGNGVDSPVELAPLAPAESENEAAARIVALEGATTGRLREEVIVEIERDFPEVDANDLTARFYS